MPGAWVIERARVVIVLREAGAASKVIVEAGGKRLELIPEDAAGCYNAYGFCDPLILVVEKGGREEGSGGGQA